MIISSGAGSSYIDPEAVAAVFYIELDRLLTMILKSGFKVKFIIDSEVAKKIIDELEVHRNKGA